MAYDSNALDAELAQLGVEMIAPHNPTKTKKTQDGRSCAATVGAGDLNPENGAS